MILLHFTQFSDSAFCIPEGHQACTGARHFPTTNIPCALISAHTITLRMPLTKGVSELRSETNQSNRKASTFDRDFVYSLKCGSADPHFLFGSFASFIFFFIVFRFIVFRRSLIFKRILNGRDSFQSIEVPAVIVAISLHILL